MESRSIINGLLLCILNSSFMVAEIFLNSVVIISLWRSSQRRKQLCYFMILVLSCFDLAAVVILHPLLIASTILWFVGSYSRAFNLIRLFLTIHLEGFSMSALLTLNIERFLALNYPFFHQSSVTKKRITIFLVFWTTIQVTLSPLIYFYETKFPDALIIVFISLLLFAFIYLNYKMLFIAKSKREDKRITPADAAMNSNEERKLHMIVFKNISTCWLAVGCFFIFCLPEFIYSVICATLNCELQDIQVILLGIWSNTFLFMNSTFNCLIFFWKNSFLRREGVKTVKTLLEPMTLN